MATDMNRPVFRRHLAAIIHGISQETLSRFERGNVAEFGSRKLLAVLSVLGVELQISETIASGSLDDLRWERGSP